MVAMIRKIPVVLGDGERITAKEVGVADKLRYWKPAQRR